MKIANILSKVGVIVKYGAIVVAFIKAVEFFANEMNKLKTDENDV